MCPHIFIHICIQWLVQSELGIVSETSRIKPSVPSTKLGVLSAQADVLSAKRNIVSTYRHRTIYWDQRATR